jgi:hypothetical protein
VLSRLYGHHVDVVNVHGRILIVAGPDLPDHAIGDVGPIGDVRPIGGARPAEAG